ncbi:dihydrolipoamide acetyltransferase family protein [Listeria ivanovii]|uniref:Dihydrolipoamide acetyltransferase component of pyruvate dehydrogenase complex n=1 Tax=Listeria ivanovii (strain ATCC BAA-678 / PAM 55) TaxID=881621 RepID=G2Z8B3_LISIP|nr:dihydrolipoamide acetyltransferase family protein [Listeria ivanovii]AHI55869.1 branched-chain alpha-keto acid dehydrogenase subunit E2 [Listeria ivanovii WSLC3009]AIS65312.1 branched-chain alpha-keto acid dehydrogenase subunit E2 [Listeria ivanovii subsp. ivanovii]MBC1760026.1 2-oxo acid dehydrogenase subunit E2 [Listeria ivanovii]MBK3914534.1 2-oxo acid dehydrogenase subunit E2 [Listeria ivanovii subsp. ivanovii]MBK3921568.1 2-oxo acid dehydrogenase subunit E2 [Listeria ivanovii subsp. iv
MAVEKITMPKLGESVTEGTISSWLVKPGDTVEKYDAIAEVLTDKVTAEIPSSFSGTIKEILAEEEETLEVGEVICTIETAKAESAEVETEEQASEVPKEKNESAKQVTLAEVPASGRFSPAVLRIAGENNIDLNTIQGTGKGGRITRKDLLQVMENGPATSKPEQPLKRESEKSSAPVQTSAGDKEIPINGVRKAIAKHMSISKQEIPHAWMMVEADATSLVRYRNSVKDSFKKEEGYSLTYFSFFIKAVAQALKEFPQLNSTWAGDKIIEHGNVNISIAIAAGDLLYVPVIKNADEKSVKGIAREISELASKARSGKLAQADMEGGTFTVNSTGSFGSVQSMGIINHPQAAILQVESIVKRPVIVDDMIAVRDMVNLCLSIDHRILDGLLAGKFLQAIKSTVEKISKENTALY